MPKLLILSSNPRRDLNLDREISDLTTAVQRLGKFELQPIASEQIYQLLDGAGSSLSGLRTLLNEDRSLEQFAQNPLILSFMSGVYQVWSVEKNVLRWLNWLANPMVQEKQTIFLIEKMQPLWLQNRTEKRSYSAIAFMIAALIAGPLVGITVGMDSMTLYSSLQVPYALSAALIAAIICGLVTGLPKEISPLEKLNWSWQKAKSRVWRELLIGAIAWLVAWLLAWLITQSFYPWIFGMSAGLIAALVGGLKYGGAACIQHFALRQMFHQKGCIPWNYARFLDFASSRLLMKKVGGGYVFFHRMLLEHFAQVVSHSG